MMENENIIEPTFNRILRIWWSYIWRVTLFSMLLGFILGFAAGFITGILGRGDLAQNVAASLGWLGSIPVSIYVMGIVLKKNHGDFTICLMKASDDFRVG